MDLNGMDPIRSRRRWTAFIRIGVSFVCGGISYVIWLAAFLLATKLNGPVVETALWLLAPVATAIGFTLGIRWLDHLTVTRKTSFFRVLAWPLMGCAIGATVVYWFGPMLIVFGMLVAGAASVALREAVMMRAGC